jgi:hypothetical protein
MPYQQKRSHLIIIFTKHDEKLSVILTVLNRISDMDTVGTIVISSFSARNSISAGKKPSRVAIVKEEYIH